MDCREVQYRLKDIRTPEEAPTALRDHVAACAGCARLWQAAVLLEQSFDLARLEGMQETVPSLHETRVALEKRLAASRLTPWRRLAEAWRFGTSGVRWTLRAGVAVAAIAFLTLVPFQYQKTVGYEVALAGVDPELARHEDRLQALLAGMGAGGARVNWIECDSVCSLTITDLPDLNQCRLLVSALGQLCKVTVLESGARVCEMESGPLLEVALNRVRSASFGGVSESEAQEFLLNCLGETRLCDLSECPPALAELCSTVCAASPAVCCLVGDSLQICVPGAGSSCGVLTGPAGSCGPGSPTCGPAFCAVPPAAAQHDPATDAEVSPKLVPQGFDLLQNHPNPFNPETEIAFTLPASSEVRLDIFNTLGRRVRTLVSGVRGAGTHRVTWDARSDQGERVPSGTYLYRLTAGEQVQSRTMTLLK